jgi:hypothetical protein
LCNKLRNRLLSKTSCLLLGNEIISILTLSKIISTRSKIHHGLVHSDVQPRDRQNFSSCQKISSDDVLNILEMSSGDIPSTKGMCVYLKLIRSIIIAHYEKKTSLNDRLHHAWLSVFICRFWSACLDTQPREKLIQQYLTQFSTLRASLSAEWNEKIKLPNRTKMKTKQQFTITHPCHYSIEMNAHSLTYLVLAAIERQIILPFEALSIDLFNSQSCESAFRSARSMSGASSSIVNFTVFDFSRRADKISAIQSIKVEHESCMSGVSLRFPRHHKHGRSTSDSNLNSMNSSLKHRDIQQIVEKAFVAAYDLIKPLIDEKVFKRKEYDTIGGLSKFIFKRFHASKLGVRSSQQMFRSQSHESTSDWKGTKDDDEYEDEDVDEDESESESEDEAGENSEHEEEEELHEIDPSIDTEDKEEKSESLEHIILDSSDASFRGMRVKESIEPSQVNSYFKVQREKDSTNVYIHKQTGSWVLLNDKHSLSSDRLQRVTQGKNR